MWEIKKIVSKGNYNYAVVKEHPYATKHGYVLEHRIVVENHLNRLLDANEVVHHINGCKKDNRIENLEVLDSKEHSRRHGFEQGKMYALLKCPNCSIVFERPYNKTFRQTGGTATTCSRTCGRYFSIRKMDPSKTDEVQKAISENIVSTFRRVNDNTEEIS